MCERVRVVREAVGREPILIIDANYGGNDKIALRILDELANANIFFLLARTRDDRRADGALRLGGLG